MPSPIIHVFCPDDDFPSGGIRKMYRHVDVLNRHGYKAVILHSKPGFRPSWFASDTPVVYTENTLVKPSDYLVLTEILAAEIGKIAPGIRKVIFNQNCYYSFRKFFLDRPDPRQIYLHPEVAAALVVSEDSRDYLRFAFPELKIQRIHYGIDQRLFAYHPDKQKLIGFMPRKNAEDVRQVVCLLKARNALGDFRLRIIDNLDEAQTGQALKECALFLSFGYPEGFGLPPAEAMACGCIAIGYHGQGGREFFQPDFAFPIEQGDVIGFARTVEEVVRGVQATPELFAEKGRRAAQFIQENYSLEREENSIVDCWREILQKA
jgi:glycosyltransferase involved in cell wall biosynthesis